MLEIKHLLRKAYKEALQGNVSYNSINIPIYEEELNTVLGPAIIPAVPPIEAYIILDNQTVNDASLKCGFNQDSSLQLDVITVFNKNSGGSLISDLISNEILSILFPVKQIALPTQTGIKIWRGWLEGSRTIKETTDNSRIFRNKLIFNHSITQ